MLFLKLSIKDKSLIYNEVSIKNHLNKNGVVYKNLSKGFLHKNMMDTDTLENIIK